MANSEIQNKAQQILEAIAFTPFEECFSLSRDFPDISNRPGIYAVKHRGDGLLYIGKTQSLRKRFKGGHKAFLWAWLDQYIAIPFRLQYKNGAITLAANAIHCIQIKQETLYL